MPEDETMPKNSRAVDRLSLAGERTIGPYSDAVKVGGLILLSGRIGLDYASMRLVEGGIREQTRQCLVNIAEVLELAGATMADVVKTTVFLRGMAAFAEMNAAYGEVFAERRPARSTVAVAGLPMDALVEIEVVAAI